MSDLNLESLFNSYLQQEQVNDNVPVWEEIPLSFKDFVSSPEHMNFPTYSQRQLDVMEFMFGTSYEDVFTNEHSLAILAFGKGCVTSDTIIQDAFTYKKYTIKELIDNKLSIYVNCFDSSTGKSTIEKASVPWVSGYGSIFEVKTESGKTIKVYKDHQFLTRSGWTRLSDLNVGDEILDDVKEDSIRIAGEFKKQFKNYTEQDVKTYLLTNFPISGQDPLIKSYHKGIYQRCIGLIMGPEWRSKKFGSHKENHPLWGTHQSEESRIKNSESNKIASRKFWKSERGQQLKELFRKRFSGKNGSMYGKPAPHGSGKCKYYKFKNLQGEEFYLQGTWEVKFAEFLNSKNIHWIKNKDRFPFVDKKGSDRTYCPDFKLFFEDSVLYVEIKGYVSEEVKLKEKAVLDSGKEYVIIDKECFMNNYYYYEEPILKFDKIVSIDYIGEDNYYDLEVNKYHNYLAHGLYNHNSGKDTMSVHATLYVVYLLLCCKNPLSLFKGVTSDYIDILNVAYNYRQAIDVFMAKLILSVKNWRWLRDKYKYIDSGKTLKNDKKYETMDVVNIKQDRIIFPKFIRAMAKCSQQDAAEGTNLLVWIADEFSAFSDKNSKSNAMEMFDTLRTSSTTRFQNYGKGFVISFTRYKNDPILRLIKQYENNPNVYTDIASTFEVKPKSAFSGEWGTWNGISMPKSFIADFERDPEGSKAKYLCQPPDAEDPWITETQFIDSSFIERVPMFEFTESINTTINGNMVTKELVRKNFNIPDKMFVLAGDIGLTTDRSVITMWHDESSYLPDNTVIKHYVQDFILSWVPDKKQNRKVDINNIEYIIRKIIFEYNIPISGVYFDHFNSAQLLDLLASKGIVSQQHTLKAEDFSRFKVLLYTKSLNFIKESVQESELRGLTTGRDGKPDHVSEGHDDTFRANCMAISALEGFKGTGIVVNEDGMFLKGLKKVNKVNPGSDSGDTIKTKLHSNTVNDDDIFNTLNNINGLNRF